MSFLHLFRFKRTIWVIIFCSIFVSLDKRATNACTNIEQKRHILLEQKPEQLLDANFIGKIEIQEVKEKGIAIAILLESQTHPLQIGKKVTIAYERNLCSDKLKIGNTGFIIGKSIEMGNFHNKFLFVRPYPVSVSQNELQDTAEEEKILIYCFKGHRDNNYVHTRGNNCSSDL